MLSLLLHNLTFSSPRSQDDDPVRDCITHEIKVYAYNNNNTNHRTTKTKPVDAKSITYTDPSKNNNNKDSELKTGDILRISKY